MALYQYEVHFKINRGINGDMVEKVVPMAYDDVDPDVPEWEVGEWAKRDATQYLRERDCTEIIFIDIYAA